MTAVLKPAVTAGRKVVHRTRGHTHGPITRLMSPSDLGELLKPFVFLDLFVSDDPAQLGGFPMHPHSGIATLTYLVAGGMEYADSTGQSGQLQAGSVEWMRAGGGVWHTGKPTDDVPAHGFQLWIALPEALENAPAESQYLSPAALTHSGPATVLLGQYAGVRSAIAHPADATYLAVHLRAGETWTYQPPAGHSVGWLAVDVGELDLPEPVVRGDMLVFDQSEDPITLRAQTDAVLVLGSAVPHPHPLVMGRYSVHTSAEALRRGEDGIRQVAQRLRAEGVLGQR